jgi:hypothetical protein
VCETTPVVCETTPVVCETTPVVCETTPVVCETTPVTDEKVSRDAQRFKFGIPKGIAPSFLAPSLRLPRFLRFHTFGGLFGLPCLQDSIACHCFPSFA